MLERRLQQDAFIHSLSNQRMLRYTLLRLYLLLVLRPCYAALFLLWFGVIGKVDRGIW